MIPQEVVLSAICNSVKDDVSAVIAKAEAEYTAMIHKVCHMVLEKSCGRMILLLAGPSASGKTTTAHRIGRVFKEQGRNSAIVSLDNFYLDRELSPRFPDGRPDYESVNALDLPLMEKVLKEFLMTGHCEMPIFDFSKGMRSPFRQEISLGEDDIIILEGLHALNPVIVDHLPPDMAVKLYVSVGTRVTDDNGKVILNKKDLRLLRRLVRDDKFRDFDVNETFDIWTTVVYGEKKYLVPFKETADVQINSFHAYEVCALAEECTALLKLVKPESTHYKKAQDFITALQGVPLVSKQMIPENSLLREFLGH